MILPHLLQQIVDELQTHGCVDAVLLAGSRGKSRIPDSTSDYDLYVYLSDDLPAAVRERILSPRCSVLELDNRFWEPEDDGELNDGTAVEFIYRRTQSFLSSVRSVALGHQASVGYSTCLWENLIDSHLLFDRSGILAQAIIDLEVPYPQPLREAIVAKNWPLLRDATCSFRHQVLQALVRQDWVSVQHRTAAFLASVFDVVFAINKVRHPGEKRLVQRSLQLASLPLGWEALVSAVAGPPMVPEALIANMDRLTTAVETLLVHAGLLKSARVVSTVTKVAPAEIGPLTVYTDGGCIGNPGKGAWAFLVEDGAGVSEASGGEGYTTNNKMELQAVISALALIDATPSWKSRPVVIHTDSQYVRNGITAWIKSWEANGWKTAAKEPVKNKELWIELQKWDKALNPQWKWVKGHAGNPRNERCDALVRQTMDKMSNT
jgi:ribonuclease HI